MRNLLPGRARFGLLLIFFSAVAFVVAGAPASLGGQGGRAGDAALGTRKYDDFARPAS